MKRKDWYIVVGTLLVVIILDQITKIWANGITDTQIGFIRLVLVHNHGAMLGLFSELPAVLRIVTLSTSGVFILCIYSLLQYLISKRLLSLRLGLSILVGGILGNVLDRILYGYVIDFIAIRIGSFHSPVWNLADVIQWVGYAIMTVALIKNSHDLWPDQNTRKSFWVNKKFQIKYSLFISSIGLFLTLIGFVFSYTYFKVTLEELVGMNSSAVQKFITPFIITYFVLTCIFLLILFLVGKFISHQVAGPIYAFERFLKEALDGDGLKKSGAALKLRTGDEFKHLEELAEKVKSRLLEINQNHQKNKD